MKEGLMMFFGSIVAVVTPFKQGKIDFEAFVKILENLIQSGSHAIVVGGSTGEGSLLSFEERKELLALAIYTASGRVPIISGCSTMSTSESINIVDQAEILGCSAALVTPPAYVRPTQRGVIDHFKALYAHTTLPLIIYNNPTRIGMDISVETVLELAKIPTVVAIKDSHPDVSRLSVLRQKIKSMCDQNELPQTKPFSLLSGDSPYFAAALAMGADGCVSITANACPELSVKLYDAWKAGDQKTFEEIRDKLVPVDELMCAEVNPTPIKYIMHKLGFCENEVRLPLHPISKELELRIDRVLSFSKEALSKAA